MVLEAGKEKCFVEKHYIYSFLFPFLFVLFLLHSSRSFTCIFLQSIDLGVSIWRLENEQTPAKMEETRQP